MPIWNKQDIVKRAEAKAKEELAGVGDIDKMIEELEKAWKEQVDKTRFEIGDVKIAKLELKDIKQLFKDLKDLHRDAKLLEHQMVAIGELEEEHSRKRGLAFIEKAREYEEHVVGQLSREETKLRKDVQKCWRHIEKLKALEGKDIAITRRIAIDSSGVIEIAAELEKILNFIVEHIDVTKITKK